MAYVYKITNDINGKSYIGKTEFSIEKRFKEHCSDRNRRQLEKRPLYAAMNKYGIEHFYVEQIEECSSEVIDQREMFWIQYFDTYNNGYNATLGGDGKSYIDTSLILSLWNQNYTITDIRNITGYDINTIRKYLYNNNISAKQIKNRADMKCSKPVAMIDKNNDKIIKVFSSIKEAEKYLNLSYQSHISKVCKGQRKIAHGYKWKFVD